MNRIDKILLVFCAVMLSACGDSDDSLPPAELTDFEASHELKLNWDNAELEGVGQQYVHLEALLLDKKMVVASRDGLIISIDLQTGETLDRLDIDTVISGGVGGNQDIAIISTRNGEVIAFDPGTMTLRWRQSVTSEVLAKPVLSGNQVIVKSSDGKMLALDASSGEINWSYQQKIPALTLRGSSTPVITRDRLFTGLENGRLVALSSQNGDVLWDVALALPQGRSEISRLVDIDGNAELYGQTLYVSSFQGRIAAIDVGRGQVLWARPFSSNTGVSVDSKAVYSTDEQGHIWAFDRFSGATLWKQGKLEARHSTLPIPYGEFLLVGDYAGYIHMMSRFDGHFIARFDTASLTDLEEESTGILVSPKVAGDHIFISSRNGNVYSLSLAEKLN